MKKHESNEGPKAREKFERTAKELFKVSKKELAGKIKQNSKKGKD